MRILRSNPLFLCKKIYFLGDADIRGRYKGALLYSHSYPAFHSFWPFFCRGDTVLNQVARPGEALLSTQRYQDFGFGVLESNLARIIQVELVDLVLHR